MYHVSLKYADHIWNLSKKRKKEKILYFIHVKFCKHDPYWPEQDPLTNIRYVSMLSNCHILILNRWKAVHLLPCNGNKILTLPRQYSFRHLVACVTKSALYASHSCAFQHLPYHTCHTCMINLKGRELPHQATMLQNPLCWLYQRWRSRS